MKYIAIILLYSKSGLGNSFEPFGNDGLNPE